MGKYESLIGAAGILGLISFSSLLQEIYKTHNTTSLPWTWIITNLAAQTLAFAYGAVNMSYGIMLPGVLFISGLFYILYVKLKHKQYETPEKKVQL
jgi:surface polysaccharide O-acyltransferase-like enzyme